MITTIKPIVAFDEYMAIAAVIMLNTVLIM